MKPTWTIAHIDNLIAAGKIRGYHLYGDTKHGKRSKYRNKRTEIDGIKFDSEKEAKRYGDLRLMLKAGLIGQLQLQVPFELNPGGTHSLKYIADFTYLMADSGEYVVEDVKGYRTREYLKKKRLMLKVHGIKIKEI